MGHDPVGYLHALEGALAKLFRHDHQLIDSMAPIMAINHRLGVYLEEEFKASLLYHDWIVDLMYKPHMDDHEGPVPSLGVHRRGQEPPRSMAIECRWRLLSSKDKQGVLALEDHLGGYDYAYGICYKPGARYFLWYFIHEGAMRFKRIRKDAVVLRPYRP